MAAKSRDLSAILQQVHLSEPEDVLKAANAALNTSKSDATAHRARIVALLKLERYTDVLKAFDAAGPAVRRDAPLELAYALYKSGENDKAIAFIEQEGSKSRALMHVAAQANYRLENFERAAEIYGDLFADSETRDAENDLRINRAAIDAQLEWTGKGHLVSKKRHSKDDLEVFERSFNAACASIARGEFRQAEVLLTRARQLCSASEDLDEELRKSELLPITLQQAYVLARMRRDEDIAKFYQTVRLDDTTDEDTKYIGLVNAVASFADQEASTGKYNPFHARRLFHSATPPTDNTRLFRYQSLVVEQNRLNIDIQSFKNEGVSRSTLSKLSSESTTDPILNTLSVVNSVAVSGPEATEKHVLRTTLELLKKRPYDLGLTLLASQIHIRASNYQAAASVLESLLSHLPDTDPTRHAPGLVALAVALYTHLGRPAAAKATLASAASHWRTAAPDTGSHDALLRAAAAALLLQRSSSSASGAEEEQEAGRDARAARAIFAGLHARRPDDAACAAGLAAALAACGPAAALAERPELVAALRPARELVDGVDVDALEAQGVARPAVAAEAAKADAADGGPARKRRKRSLPPSRRPKDFVEGREPADKERWLPLRERSYWRPKGKKGRARAAGLTQGGVVEEKEKSGTVSEVKKAAPSAKGKKKKGRK